MKSIFIFLSLKILNLRRISCIEDGVRKQDLYQINIFKYFKEGLIDT